MSNNSNKNVLKIFYENGQELVSVNGVTGVLANKSEIESFRGPIPLSEYPINDDPNPIVVPKKCATPHHATQEITIRYLEPPPLPPPGDIIIQQELSSVVAPPAPPIIIRTKPEVKQPPQPLVIREAPPLRQIPIDRKIIKLPGSKVAPPPRKLIIEKPPPISDKAQPIVIERWLAPKVQPRRVIVDGTIFTGHPPIRNEIRVCEAPNVIINKEFINLGVTRADPNEYVSKYGNTLVEWKKLPEVARDIKPPTGVVLASEARSNLPPLEGDVHLLKYVDLEREGLSEYASYIHSFRSSKESTASNVTNTNTVANNIINSSLNTSSYTAQQRNESYSDRRNESSNERVVSTTTTGLPRPPSGGVIRTIVRNSYQVPLTSANNTYTAANVTNPNNSSTVTISNPNNSNNNTSSTHVCQGNGHTTTTYNIKYTHERRYVKDNNF